MKEQFFKASLDTVSKIITSLMAPIFTIFPIYLFFSLRNEPDQSLHIYFIGIIVLLNLIFVGCVLYWVKGYTVNETQLIIHRLKGKKIFLLADIAKHEALTKKEMGFVLRVLGNGGIFGYTGFFTNKTFGRMNWFVTSQQNLVIITLNNNKVIAVSPDDVVGFRKLLGK
jgi:fumarate reductase subunit C